MSSLPRQETPLVLGPESNGILMTLEEFDAVEEYDENYVYELIHGVLVVSPVPSEAEVGPNEELGRLLLNYRDNHPKGSAGNETLPERYVRTATSRRRADRVIWTGLGRVPNPQVDVPVIVVEFVSAGKRNCWHDYVVKRDEYLALGVKEYWIIDRFRRCLTVYRADGPEIVVPEKKTYRSPHLPGFALPLAKLLAVADRWTKKED